jgi:membrane protein
MSRWLKISWQAAKSWRADNSFQHSAAVSFYTLFSLAPITIIAVTLAGWVVGQERAGHQLELQLTELVGPASARIISEAAKASERDTNSWWATAAGAGLMVVGATTVFAQLQESLNLIWGVRAHPKKRGWVVLLLHRLVSFGMVLTIGFLLLVSLVLTTILTTALHRFDGTPLGSAGILKIADIGVGLVIISVLFALLFKVMPDVRLQWREIWLGASLTACLFTVGRYAIAWYLGHSTVASIYGSAGSLVALLIWVYYSCAILFYGIEFVRAYLLFHRLPVRPKSTAVLIDEKSSSEQTVKKRA